MLVPKIELKSADGMRQTEKWGRLKLRLAEYIHSTRIHVQRNVYIGLFIIGILTG